MKFGAVKEIEKNYGKYSEDEEQEKIQLKKIGSNKELSDQHDSYGLVVQNRFVKFFQIESS